MPVTTRRCTKVSISPSKFCPIPSSLPLACHIKRRSSLLSPPPSFRPIIKAFYVLKASAEPMIKHTPRSSYCSAMLSAVYTQNISFPRLGFTFFEIYIGVLSARRLLSQRNFQLGKIRGKETFLKPPRLASSYRARHTNPYTRARK